MRKVMFKKWIPIEYLKSESGGAQRVKDTGCWEKEFSKEGKFHQWASNYEEFESGAGNFTVGLVELTTGEIESVFPSNLKFVDYPSY